MTCGRRAATAIHTTAPPAAIARADTLTGFSVRLNGAVGARPVPADVAVGASGSWIVTDWAAGVGILIGALHLGQGPVRPAYWSLTLNLALQPGQMTGIGMGERLSPGGGHDQAGNPAEFRQCQNPDCRRQGTRARV